MNELARFTIDGLVFSHEEKSDEPMIRDVDLAVRLEYVRPRTVRTLIQRMIGEGRIRDVAMRPTVQRIVKTGAVPGVEMRSTNEYWLTEAQAIKVAARSDTEKADSFLDEVIRVFILARKGLLVPAHSHVPVLDALERLLLSRARVRDNDHAKATMRGAIGGTAKARGETFARCHGALRRQFCVPSYQTLTLAEVPRAVEWLQSMVKDTPVGLLARQLSFWPERLEVQ